MNFIERFSSPWAFRWRTPGHVDESFFAHIFDRGDLPVELRFKTSALCPNCLCVTGRLSGMCLRVILAHYFPTFKTNQREAFNYMNIYQRRFWTRAFRVLSNFFTNPLICAFGAKLRAAYAPGSLTLSKARYYFVCCFRNLVNDLLCKRRRFILPCSQRKGNGAFK